MSGKKEYVICRKQVKPKCNEIPKTTYVAETFVSGAKPKPIKVNPQFDNLAKPKKIPEQPPLEPIPKFENKPPEFAQVDYRVTQAALTRDLHVMHKLINDQAAIKESEPKEFYEWQRKMREKDEEEREIAIQKRREDLNNCRRRAMKAKKKEIAEKLEVGRKMRIDFGEEFAKVQGEIDAEREQIRELKRQMVNNGPTAVENVAKKKILESREVRATIRNELKLAAKLRAEENKTIHDNAVKLRDQLVNHTNRHGDAFTEKIEITDTKFLAALTDEEANELIQNHAEEKRRHIEEQIEEHRAIKEKKMQKLVDMLNEATKIREQKEEEHEKARKEKKEEEEKERQKKEEEEEQKMLLLEKKLEKKRQQRINEAAEMEEHARQIDARTRYLALNKKTLATKVFQSQQDGRLRAAKERQTRAMNETGLEKKSTKNTYANAELTSLKGLLGM